MALAAEVDRLAALLSMARRGLQGAHAHLDAIVRRQPLDHERRQEDVGLAELLDDARFHCGTRFDVSIAHQCAAAFALDHSSKRHISRKTGSSELRGPPQRSSVRRWRTEGPHRVGPVACPLRGFSSSQQPVELARVGRRVDASSGARARNRSEPKFARQPQHAVGALPPKLRFSTTGRPKAKCRPRKSSSQLIYRNVIVSGFKSSASLERYCLLNVYDLGGGNHERAGA